MIKLEGFINARNGRNLKEYSVVTENENRGASNYGKFQNDYEDEGAA
jgi:hypothetical protein